MIISTWKGIQHESEYSTEERKQELLSMVDRNAKDLDLLVFSGREQLADKDRRMTVLVKRSTGLLGSNILHQLIQNRSVPSKESVFR